MGMDDEVVIFGDFRADNTVTSLGLKAGLTSCSEGNDYERAQARDQKTILYHIHSLIAGQATYVRYGTAMDFQGLAICGRWYN